MSSDPRPLDELLTEALAHDTGPPRDAWITRACAGQPGIERELRELIEAHETAAAFMSIPRVAAPTIDVEPGGSAVPDTDRELHDVRPDGPTPRMGRYKLLQRIGEGGFGVVYMAEQEKPVRRKVALKVIKLGMDTHQVIGRFEAERQALAMMDHPNIARVLDAGATDTGRPYFVMELVKGEPITNYCDRNQLSTGDRLRLFVDVCRAVQHAHQKGIIHRDLKPSNVMVTLHDGRPVPKVIDFGIAKATNARLTERTVFTEYRQLIGTPEYMSPEQAEMSGLDVDTRSDVYSLGVLLYELLTDTTPFDATAMREASYAEIQRIIREEDPPRPSTRLSTMGDALPETARHRRADALALTRALRGDLDWIVMRCLEKDRTRRYATANGLAADIERHLIDEPVVAGPPSASYRVSKFMRRNRALVTTIGVIAGVLVVATVVSTIASVIAVRAGREARDQLQRAEAAELQATGDAAAAKIAQADAERSAVAAQTARDQAEAVTNFLTSMLASVDPAEDGRDVKVIDLLGDASAKVGTDFDAQPLLEAEVRSVLAATFVALGEYGEAEPHALLTVEIRAEHLGRDHAETLAAMNELGHVYFLAGDYAKAEPILVETLAARRRALGDDDPDTGESMNNLGGLYIRTGHFEEGVPLLVETIAIRRRVHGDTDRRTLASMQNLAGLYTRLGRFDEAETILTEVIASSREGLGVEHPNTLTALTTLATLHGYVGDFDKAAPLFVEIADTQERVLGEDHPNRLITLSNLAVVYELSGRTDLAEPVHGEVLAVRRRTLGDDHSLTIQSMLGLAFLLQNDGRYDEAEKLYDEVLERGPRTLEESNPLMVRATIDLATLLLSREPETDRDPARALALSERACATMTLTDPDYLQVLARARFETGDVAGAIETQRRVVELVPDNAPAQAALGEYEAAVP